MISSVITKKKEMFQLCFLVGIIIFVPSDAFQDFERQEYLDRAKASVEKTYKTIDDTNQTDNSFIQYCKQLELDRLSVEKNRFNDKIDDCDTEDAKNVREIIILPTFTGFISTFASPYFSSPTKTIKECYLESIQNFEESLRDTEEEVRACTIHKCFFFEWFSDTCVDPISDKATIKKRSNCLFMKLAIKKIEAITMKMLFMKKEKNGIDDCYRLSAQRIISAYPDPLDEIRSCKHNMVESLSASLIQCLPLETLKKEVEQMKDCMHAGLKSLRQLVKEQIEEIGECRREKNII